MTARELLEDALAKAEGCIAPTSACARLHIARVMARSDETEARKVWERALQELRDIQLTPHDRAGIEREAYLLTGAVAPELARQREGVSEHLRHLDESSFVHVLLAHGHLEAAIDFLLSYRKVGSYPSE